MTDLPPLLLRCLSLLFISAFAWPACAGESSRPVAGLIESVLVGNPGVAFEGKLDTGADLSSIDAINVKRFKRAGQIWIDFTVVRVDASRVKISAPLVRTAHIKRGGGTAARRPVVLLELCLGSVSRAVEVTLADRHGLEYDVLVGRNFLNGYFIVDPARAHALPPKCSARRTK